MALWKNTITFYYLYYILEASSVVITKNSIADIRKKEGNNSKPPHGNNSTIHPFKTQLLLPAFLIRNSPFVLLLKYCLCTMSPYGTPLEFTHVHIFLLCSLLENIPRSSISILLITNLLVSTAKIKITPTYGSKETLNFYYYYYTPSWLFLTGML